MPIGKLAIVAALSDEVRGISKLLSEPTTIRVADIDYVSGRSSGVEVSLLLTGIGAERAEARTRALLEAEEVEALVAVGFAGGLRDVHLAGDILVAEELVAAAAPLGDGPEAFASAPELLELVPTQLDVQQLVRRGRMATVGRILTTRADKADARERESADVVDLESGGIARAARSAGVPALYARAVVDDSEMDLPLDFSRLVTETGRPRALRLALALALRPWAIPGLLDVRKRTIKAAASLTSLVAVFLDNNGSKEECQKTDPDPQRSPYSPPE